MSSFRFLFSFSSPLFYLSYFVVLLLFATKGCKSDTMTADVAKPRADTSGETATTAKQPWCDLACPSCTSRTISVRPAYPRFYRLQRALSLSCCSAPSASSALSWRAHCWACQFRFSFQAPFDDPVSSDSILDDTGSAILETDKRHRQDILRPPSSAAWVMRTGWTPQPDLMAMLNDAWCAECGQFVQKQKQISWCPRCGATFKL